MSLRQSSFFFFQPNHIYCRYIWHLNTAHNPILIDLLMPPQTLSLDIHYTTEEEKTELLMFSLINFHQHLLTQINVIWIIHASTSCKYMHLKALFHYFQKPQGVWVSAEYIPSSYWPCSCIFFARCTHPGRRSTASGPLTVALLPIMIPPVRTDPVAWNCIECNGHREFRVSSDKWPGPGSGSADSGAVWLITPAADTNTATGFVCRLLHYPQFLQHAHIMFPLPLSAVISNQSEGPFSFESLTRNFHPAKMSKC